MGQVLSELSAMTCLSWAALQSLAYGFPGSHKPLCRDKAVIVKGGVVCCSPWGRKELDTTGRLNQSNKVKLRCEVTQEEASRDQCGMWV